MGSRPLSRGQVQGGRWRVKTRRASLAGSTGQSDPGFAKSGETDPDPGSGDSAAPPPPRHVTSKGSLSLECGHLCSAPEELVGRRGSAGSADWRGGGGALEGPFQRVSWWSEGRRFGFVRGTCKYGPRNSICPLSLPYLGEGEGPEPGD